MGKGDRPSGPTIASGRPLRAGVRIVTNHGPISRVIPDPRDTKAHLERLISDGFPIVAVLDADPLRPETVIECVFQVPAGGMVDFERLAGSYRHARIFRPAKEARFHHLQPTLKP